MSVTINGTSSEDPAGPAGRRSTDEVLRDQMAGIDAWHAARRAAQLRERAAEISAHSREMRLDLARRMDVIRREHQALMERTELQLRESGRLLANGPARAVIVHRNEWFRDKVGGALAAGGIDVIARLENGADAVGVTVAEQPDLILVEDRLPMITGEEVIRQVLQFAPATLPAAQVGNDWEIAALLEAGARKAFSRRVPPADVAAELCLLVTA